MPEINIDDFTKIPKETFPFEIKINSGENSNIFSMFKNIGFKNVLNDD